jgi:hypothetical protein
MKPRVVFLAIAMVCMFALGCWKKPAPANPNFRGPTGVIAFDQGSVYYLGTAFVVWAEGSTGGGGGQSTTEKGTVCQGRLQTRGGHDFRFRCETKDGKSGRVTIGDATYDLADGNLFLVRMEGEQLSVKQLARGLDDVKLEPESLQAFARNDPDIAGFFAKPAKPK